MRPFKSHQPDLSNGDGEFGWKLKDGDGAVESLCVVGVFRCFGCFFLLGCVRFVACCFLFLQLGFVGC